MSCGAGSPIATELGAAISATQIAQSSNPDFDEAKLQLRRTINQLVGAGPTSYDETVGGMQYVPSTRKGEYQGLGKGVIPDLKKVRGDNDSGWLPADADAALEAAQSALESAKKGRDAPDIATLKRAALDVVSQLQSALKIALKPALGSR